jgi:hypothetical protein
VHVLHILQHYRQYTLVKQHKELSQGHCAGRCSKQACTVTPFSLVTEGVSPMVKEHCSVTAAGLGVGGGYSS